MQSSALMLCCIDWVAAELRKVEVSSNEAVIMAPRNQNMLVIAQ